MVSPELALDVACRASCAALGIGLIEYLTVFDRIFGVRGPFSGAVTTVLGAPRFPRLLLGGDMRHIVVVGAIACLLGTILGPYGPVGRVAVPVALVCVALIKLRRVMAGDGAEQLAVLTLFATCVAVLPRADHTATTLAVWFVGGQTILSYATAGIAKVISPTWRGGGALPLIMGSEAHGQPWAATLLNAHPALGRLLTRSVILFECVFPLIMVAPKGVAIGLLVVGVVFHVGCAVSMGLNTFLLAFPGSYICVVYIAQRTSPLW